MNHVYFKQPYQKSADTMVESAVREKGQLLICLEENLYHAKGGGQPDDRGEIELCGKRVPVEGLVKRKGSTYVVVRDDPAFDDVGFGEPVRCLVDWPRRYLLMRNHTAAHIAMGALARLVDGYEPCGIEIAEDGSTCAMRFTGSAGAALPDLQAVEALVAQVVAQDLPVNAESFKSVDAARATLPTIFRSDPRLKFNGNVRVVTIHEFDANPCGGSHLARTSEVGKLRLQFAGWAGSDGVMSLCLSLENLNEMPDPS